jgi:hypothetical protein
LGNDADVLYVAAQSRYEECGVDENERRKKAQVLRLFTNSLDADELVGVLEAPNVFSRFLQVRICWRVDLCEKGTTLVFFRFRCIELGHNGRLSRQEARVDGSHAIICMAALVDIDSFLGPDIVTLERTHERAECEGTDGVPSTPTKERTYSAEVLGVGRAKDIPLTVWSEFGGGQIESF